VTRASWHPKRSCRLRRVRVIFFFLKKKNNNSVRGQGLPSSGDANEAWPGRQVRTRRHCQSWQCQSNRSMHHRCLRPLGPFGLVLLKLSRLSLPPRLRLRRRCLPLPPEPGNFRRIKIKQSQPWHRQRRPTFSCVAHDQSPRRSCP